MSRLDEIKERLNSRWTMGPWKVFPGNDNNRVEVASFGCRVLCVDVTSAGMSGELVTRLLPAPFHKAGSVRGLRVDREGELPKRGMSGR